MARFFFIQDPDGYKIEFCSGAAATADWEAKMSKHILDRREFLRSAGAGAAAVVAVSGVTMILASNRAWAMTLESFGPHEAEVLLQMTRQLYPTTGWATSTTPRWLRPGSEGQGAAPSWSSWSRTASPRSTRPACAVPAAVGRYQTEVLAAMEAELFFQTVRGHTVVALYNNKVLWNDFGYQVPPGRTAAI